MMNTSLLQKSGLATLQVAQILAGLEPGDRIPTVTELSEQCEMARGNIQIALNNLKQNHVIRLESHGQNGTIATEIDYVAMAQYCSNTGLTCVMPMPYGLRYEGLASGLYEELNQKGVTGAIAFMRGSGYRLNCVEEGRFHLCVMSQLAFEHYAQEGKDIQLIAAFGPQSYVEQESHGQNGTIATEIDYVAMAQYCSNTGLTCVMPMPYGLRYEGLASGLYEELNQKGVTGAIAFMRGSGYRLNCVEEGRFHLCVMSQLAFEHYAQEGKDIQLIAAFGPQSYVEQHRVFVRPDFKGDWQNCKVGVDASSVDQEMLTRFCFADKPVQYVPIIYSQLVPFLHSGVIDAGVWSADMLPEGLSYYPMPRLDEQGKDTVAVLACRKSDNITAQLVRKILSVERVDHIQQQVMRKQIIPRY